MKLDRYMVNLFFEIKRNLPLGQQHKMLISSTKIGDVMIELYQTTEDENIKLLTGIFLERAGEDWFKQANKDKPITSVLNKLIKNASTLKSNKSNVAKHQRIYRGQVVED